MSPGRRGNPARRIPEGSLTAIGGQAAATFGYHLPVQLLPERSRRVRRTAEQRLTENDIAAQPKAAEIERVIREILAECIRDYLETLGGPIEVRVLSEP
jgi:hypothetical protein